MPARPRAPHAAALLLGLAAPARAMAQTQPAPSTATAPPASSSAPREGEAVPQPTVESVPVPGSEIPAARITVVVNAPLPVVAQVIADFDRYREFLPQMRESRVVQRRRGEADVYLQATMLGNLGVMWALVRFHSVRGPDRVALEGQMVRGNVRQMHVRLEARATPGSERTALTLEVLGVPDVPLPTAFVRRQQAPWGTRGALAMRARAEALAAQRRRAGSNPPANTPAGRPGPASTAPPAAPAVSARPAPRR